jgi:hypothetical protein
MKRLHIRPAASTAEEVQRLVERHTRPREGGGGTLLTEPIVVMRGTHFLAFEFFDPRRSRTLARRQIVRSPVGEDAA